MNRELFNILVKLPFCSWESVQDNSLSWLRLLHFFIDDLDNNFVTDESSCFDNASDGFNEGFVKSAADGALEDFSDLITSWDVVVVEIFPEEFGVGSLADTGRSEEEEEFLFGSWEVLDDAVGKPEHIFSNKSWIHTISNITYNSSLKYSRCLYNFWRFADCALQIELPQSSLSSLSPSLVFPATMIAKFLHRFSSKSASRFPGLELRNLADSKSGNEKCQAGTIFQQGVLSKIKNIYTGAYWQNNFKKM